MIFVCTGSRNYQFNRLIEALDKLVAGGEITEEIFAQIGDSTYLPKHFKYAHFLDTEDFKDYQDKARLIISHGGAGTIVGALKRGKYVIAVPRLSEYGEHIDDHQMQIVKGFEDQQFIKAVYDMDKLGDTIKFFDAPTGIKKYYRESKIINIIENYIESNL